MQDDAAYLSRRAREEREASSTAQDPRVRKCHMDLADAYELRVRAMTQAAPADIQLVAAAY